MAYPIVWPKNLLRPSSVAVAPKSQSRSGGAGVLGNAQVVQSPAFAWSITLTDIPVTTHDRILAWRAIEAQADGRANLFLVPAYDWLRSPASCSVKTSFSDDSLFSDGADLRSGVTAIKTTVGAVLNASELVVAWAGPGPQAGQYFSVGGRLHLVIKTVPIAAGAARLTIRPWLREQLAAGTRLEFDEPVCLCRLAKDDAMALDLTAWRIGHPSVAFDEAFPQDA